MWAHADDDLIFANPDLQGAITSGQCVRTLFLTASDAGRGVGYARSRELGILRAYNAMRGATGLWDTQTITLSSGARLTAFTAQGDSRITVATLRLPDGGLNAKGFAATGNTSLPLLLEGRIATLQPIDGGPALSAATLRESVAEVILAWETTDLAVQIPAGSPLAVGDHPDHGAAGTIARQASQSIDLPPADTRYYLGYPSANLPVNVSGDALNSKVESFRIYAKEDPVIGCSDRASCLARKNFGAWLQRSYAVTDAELGLP